MKSFDKELKAAELAAELAKNKKSKVDINATKLIDTLKEAPDLGMSTEDFVEIKKKLPTVPPQAKYTSLPDMPDLPDIDPSGTRSLHKTTNQASKKAIDFVKNQQSKGQLFRKLTSLLNNPVTRNIGKVARIAGPALSLASDALASEDLGSGEDIELAKMKKEAMQKRLPQDQKLLDMKAKMAAMASKPLSPADLLKKDTTPMIKELGGPADINPRLAEKLLGEQDSPDYESGLDPRMEIARRKKQLGY